jgi:high affinity Mn2+ porin
MLCHARRVMGRFSLAAVLFYGLGSAWADEPAYFVPQLLGAQYTFTDQEQSRVHSPYQGALSLLPQGDIERSHTFGAYFGVPLTSRLALYADFELFRGEGDSHATGLGGLTNGDVIRGGGGSLGRGVYVARAFLTYDIPLGGKLTRVERKVDQLPGEQDDHNLQIKFGLLAVNDDFDKSRYANSTRTQFMNWSLFNNTAWDFAADTRGYTVGGVMTYSVGAWTGRFGIYQMPTAANGNKLEGPIWRAQGDNAEVTWQPDPDGISLRALVFRNTARMGDYQDAIRIALRDHTTPDIVADDQGGRHKYGAALGMDLPLADHGDTGLFARAGWNDGHTESFVFTEVDRSLSVGTQVSGDNWKRPQDRFAIAVAQDMLSPDHRDYLAAGGSGFTLGDGQLNYRPERIAETYYDFAVTSYAFVTADVQFIRNPGYNADRGPARFYGLRVHLEY